MDNVAFRNHNKNPNAKSTIPPYDMLATEVTEAPKITRAVAIALDSRPELDGTAEDSTQFGSRTCRNLAGTGLGVSSMLSSIQGVVKYYMGCLERKGINSLHTCEPCKPHGQLVGQDGVTEAIMA